jgi:hypothetical protein
MTFSCLACLLWFLLNLIVLYLTHNGTYWHIMLQISRTESAYMSHMALSMAVSLEDCPDTVIIPESLLAVNMQHQVFILLQYQTLYIRMSSAVHVHSTYNTAVYFRPVFVIILRCEISLPYPVHQQLA